MKMFIERSCRTQPLLRAFIDWTFIQRELNRERVLIFEFGATKQKSFEEMARLFRIGILTAE